MTYALLLNRFDAPGEGVLPPDPPSPSGTGVNELSNSKLSGSGTATDWTNPFPTEGTVTLEAGTLSGHQQIVCTSTADADDKALYEQQVDVSIGDILTISCTVRAVSGSSTDPNDPHVILNHAPFNNAIRLNSRPNLETVAVDTIAYYTIQATVNGALKIRFGVDRTGSVTIEAPMVDRHNGLRTYTATDPAEAPDTGGLDVTTLPFDGQYEGLPQGFSGNNSRAVDATPRGTMMPVRYTGNIRKIQFQLASNQNTGESTKSRLGGVSAHGYPASWSYRVELFKGNSAGQVTSSALFSADWLVHSQDGSERYSRCCHEFNYTDHGLDVAVTAGEFLMLKLTNLSGSPANNFVSMNGSSVFGSNGINWCGVGRTPPEAAGRWHGDTQLFLSYSGTNTSVISKAGQSIMAVEYQDGTVDGDIGFDSTMTVMQGRVGGIYQLDQSWSASHYRRAATVLVYAWHWTTTVPAGPLLVEISGSDITTTTATIPAASIPAANGTLLGTIGTFSSPVTLSPSVTYRIRLHSPASNDTNNYRLGCRRGAGVIGGGNGYLRGTVYPSNPPQQPPPSTFSFLDRHGWSNNARQSSNSGSSWVGLGWSSNNANLPVALVTAGNVSDTLEGLT